MKFKDYINEDRFAYHDLKKNYLPKAKNKKEKANFLNMVRKANRLGNITDFEAKELRSLVEGKSGKVHQTLQNMVAIVQRKEEIDNTIDIIDKALKAKLILPVHAQRLKRELDNIGRSM